MTTIEITPLAKVQMNQRIDLLLGDTGKLENFNDYKFTIPMKALVTDMVVLTDRDFNIFKMSLLDNQEWLSGKGGTDSDYQTETEDWLQMNEEEREEEQEREEEEREEEQEREEEEREEEQEREEEEREEEEREKEQDREKDADCHDATDCGDKDDHSDCLTSAPMGQFRHIAERRVSGSS